MNFSQAIKSTLIDNYFKFKGRACRAEWWWFLLFSILASLVMSSIVAFATFGSVDWEYVATLSETQSADYIFQSDFGIAVRTGSIILSLALFLPSMSVTVRRLQDLDASFYWAIPYFLATISSLWIAAFPSAEPSIVRLDAAGNLVAIIYCLAFLRKGGYEDNRFGPNPLETEIDDTY
tara:strand:+ start:150 stop:683 length:534 start_codon:yes stop_codon:yes gene_type:complete